MSEFWLPWPVQISHGTPRTSRVWECGSSRVAHRILEWTSAGYGSCKHLWKAPLRDTQTLPSKPDTQDWWMGLTSRRSWWSRRVRLEQLAPCISWRGRIERRSRGRHWVHLVLWLSASRRTLTALARNCAGVSRHGRQRLHQVSWCHPQRAIVWWLRSPLAARLCWWGRP